MNPKPKPPLPGSEHVQVIDTGRQAVPPGVKTVNLIPVGDGGPGPLLPRMNRRKKTAGREEIAKLRRWMKTAVAELRGEIERLKAVAQYTEARTTLDEF